MSRTSLFSGTEGKYPFEGETVKPGDTRFVLATPLAALHPSLLGAFAYVGGFALISSIAGWFVGMTRAARGVRMDPLRLSQHTGYAAGYFAIWFVALLWLGRWIEGL
jgi:hypothetical protein